VKFIDEVTITVQSGNGGSGCLSFRREKFIPDGGPDGGSGGKGGDVIFTTTSRRRTLYQFQHKKLFKAPNGTPGQGKNKTGKTGADLTIEIPPGTIIREHETGEVIKDFVEPGEIYTIAQGGRGGKGNAHFKSSTHRAPRFSQPGEPGSILKLDLELKLIADVGLIGLPNAGKSTLISVISKARPKIANYPFTTLTPNLGVVSSGYGEPFVVADIPGLIQGAHTGAGLGIQFLKHIERTRILLHLIDAAEIDMASPLSSYETINNELRMHGEHLARKPQLVVLNKLDITEAADRVNKFKQHFKGGEPHTISAITGEGVKELLIEIRRMLDRIPGDE
jgi:GTPase